MGKEYVERHYGDVDLITIDDVAVLLGLDRSTGQKQRARLLAKLWLHDHKIKGVKTYTYQPHVNHWKRDDVLTAIHKDRKEASNEVTEGVNIIQENKVS